MKVGDILTIDGEKVIVTYVDGKNYSYAPYVEEPKKVVEEVVKKTTRRVKK